MRAPEAVPFSENFHTNLQHHNGLSQIKAVAETMDQPNLAEAPKGVSSVRAPKP